LKLFIQKQFGRLTLQQLTEPFYINLNRTKVPLPKFTAKIYKNGLETKLSSTIQDKDKITIKKENQPKLLDLLSEKGLSLYYQIPVIFNGEQITLHKNMMEVYRNGELLQEESLLFVGDNIQSVEKNIEPFIFQDIFRYVKIQLPSVQSGNFSLLRNGKSATFYDKLAPGDELVIQWPAMSKQH
jgi:hypothetical protein